MMRFSSSSLNSRELSPEFLHSECGQTADGKKKSPIKNLKLQLKMKRPGDGSSVFHLMLVQIPTFKDSGNLAGFPGTSSGVTPVLSGCDGRMWTEENREENSSSSCEFSKA